MRACVTCYLSLLIAVFVHAAEAPKSPLSPEESLQHFVLADENLQIEIVAAEPEVIDPVAIQFDEHGRLWVVEMRDYPTGPKEAPPPLGGPDAKPLSRIKLLEDKDGDGRFETAHLFADNLLFATGVQPWDGGVIVTLAGEVAYFKDTNGDHKADVRESWFTGFKQDNPQLRANHPTFGPDGWIYVANGLRGGDVIAVKKDWPKRAGGVSPPVDPKSADAPRTEGLTPPARQDAHDPANPKPVSLAGRDFKFDPLTGRYEAISGNGQFGMTFDAWGNRFVCDNRHPCRHVIFEEDFIRRCSHVAFPAVVHDVIPPEDKNQVFPLTSAWTTSNLHAGTFTAACGVCVYTGDLLPEEFRGNVFVCEPTGNLVQRAILEPDGVTFKSQNPYVPPKQVEDVSGRVSGTALAAGHAGAESTARDATTPVASAIPLTGGSREFLASRDDWFRPVDLQNGPDGALYVVDMYRAVIEHPEWVPDELKHRSDTWLGNDMGRIYRIRPKGEQRRPPLDELRNFAEKSLEHGIGWRRMTASRLLHEALIGTGASDTEQRRSEANRSITWASPFSSDEISAVTLFRLLMRSNGSAYDRAAGIRVLDLLVREPTMVPDAARFRQAIGSFAFDANAVVRMAALTSMSVEFEKSDVPSAGQVEKIIDAIVSDRWQCVAFTAAMKDQTQTRDALERCMNRFRDGRLRYTDIKELCTLLAIQVGRRCPEREVSLAVGNCICEGLERPDEEWMLKESVMSGINQGMRSRGKSLNDVVRGLRNKNPDFFDGFVVRVFSVATNSENEHSVGSQVAAMRILPFFRIEIPNSTFREIVERSVDSNIQLAAIELLATLTSDPEVDDWLVARYRSEATAIRRAILAALFASKERQLRLLEAIEQGQIAATELDPVRVNQLTQAKDETLRERAKIVLAAAAPASRKEVLEAYQTALTLKADPQRGREVFQRHCVTCHRVDNVGVNVAPDISDTRTKKPEQLLLDILDPNRAIDANYFAYAVVTKDGKTESGVITAETATSITLKQPEGKTLTLLRTDIEELRNTGLSLMPVGVEKNVDQQAMADLIFWLKNWRYLDGKVPATSLK